MPIPDPPPVQPAPTFRAGSIQPMPWVRVLFFTVFVALGVMGVGGAYMRDRPKENKPAASERIQAKTENVMIETLFALSALANRKVEPVNLEPIIDALAEKVDQDLDATALRVVLRHEAESEPFREDINRLAKSSSGSHRLIASLYGESRRGKWTASDRPSAEKLGSEPLFEKIAKVQVLEKLENSGIRAQSFSAVRGLRIMGISLGVLSLAAGGFISLLLIFANWKSMPPPGHPAAPVCRGMADQLMLRALIVIGSFVLASAAVTSVVPSKKFGELPGVMLTFAGLLIGIVVAVRVPVKGEVLRARRLFGEPLGLGKTLQFALAGSFVSGCGILAASLLAAAITVLFKDALPSGAHPLSEELLGKASAAKLFALFFAAAVMAPIWEEIVFRGMIFPAMDRLTGKVVWGALLSSFLFVIIHPQGPLGILMLAPIALTMCAVTYFSRSLVPAILMHAVNNGTLFLVLLLLK